LPPFTAEWIEDPVIEKPMRDYVMVESGGRGFALASRGLREASVSPEGVIALTLLRCFGWLSRDDLPNRKGGAGPQIETPQAQELGVHTYAMSLIPVMGNATTAICQARAFQSGMRGLGTGLHPGRLSTSSSFIQSESPHFVLSACKSTTDGRLLVRGVNLTAETTFIRLILGFDVLRAYDAKLDETELGELQLEGLRSVQFPCRGYEIKTLLFQPKTA
jgi:mannosylglycerate hydrolase